MIATELQKVKSPATAGLYVIAPIRPAETAGCLRLLSVEEALGLIVALPVFWKNVASTHPLIKSFHTFGRIIRTFRVFRKEFRD